MSTESTTASNIPAVKTHEIVDLSRLALVYLRQALSNPRWADGIEDYIAGSDALRAFPKLFMPKEITSDEEGLAWGKPMIDTITITDGIRDTCRKALKRAFADKAFVMNEHSGSLILIFSLKS